MKAEMTDARKRRGGGFSLLELLIVLAIMFVVTAMATPYMLNAIADYKLRTSASQLSNLLQRARAESVRRNTTVQLMTQVQGGLQTVWIDNPQGPGLLGNGARDRGEPVLILPNRITLQVAGFPGNATTIFNANQVNYTVMPTAAPVAAQFNSRGQPCSNSASAWGVVTCRNTTAPANQAQGFVYYLRSDRTFGGASWAAVVVTPAGRIRVFSYSNGRYQ